jgi:hypothetical protein
MSGTPGLPGFVCVNYALSGRISCPKPKTADMAADMPKMTLMTRRGHAPRHFAELHKTAGCQGWIEETRQNAHSGSGRMAAKSGSDPRKRASETDS